MSLIVIKLAVPLMGLLLGLTFVSAPMAVDRGAPNMAIEAVPMDEVPAQPEVVPAEPEPAEPEEEPAE